MCSVGSNLKLSIGAVARAFNETGGPALQRALNETGKRYLDPGGVLRVPLKAGKLPCDHVVFCVCCPWSDGKTAAKQVRKSLLAENRRIHFSNPLQILFLQAFKRNLILHSVQSILNIK